AEDRGAALDEAEGEPAAFAAPLALEERRGETLRRVEPGQRVDDHRSDVVRRAVPAAVDRHQAAEGLCHPVGAGPRRVGPLLAEAADGDVEEAPVARGKGRIAEPEPRRDAGAETL